METRILIIALASLLTSCTGWDTSAHRKATLSALGHDAAHVLGQLAVEELKALVGAELNGDRDLAGAAQGAAYSAVKSVDLTQIIRDATGNEAPCLADAAAEAAHEAIASGGFTREQAFDAVAKAIAAGAK